MWCQPVWLAAAAHKAALLLPGPPITQRTGGYPIFLGGIKPFEVGLTEITCVLGRSDEITSLSDLRGFVEASWDTWDGCNIL